MAFNYRKFLSGLRIKPKSVLANSEKGDLEVSDSDSKLYYFNGSVNSPVQTESSALLSTFNTLTGQSGSTATVRSASNQNLSLQAQGNGSVLVEDLTIQNNQIVGSSSSATVVQAGNNQDLNLQAPGTGVVRIQSLSIAGAAVTALAPISVSSASPVSVNSGGAISLLAGGQVTISASGANPVVVESLSFLDGQVSSADVNGLNLASNTRVTATFSTGKTDVAGTGSMSAVAVSRSYLKFTGSTPTTILGLVAQTTFLRDGLRLVVFNGMSVDLTIANQSGSESNANNRIVTPTGADVTVTPNSAIELIYDTDANRWVFVSQAASITKDATVTLTNKTMSGASNTFTAIPIANQSSGSASVNQVATANGLGGISWVTPGTVIPGIVAMWGTSSAPSGWLLCDGSSVSRTTFSALFAVIGTTFGAGDGSTTFNLPNFQGVVPRGVGFQTINTRSKTGPALGATQEDQLQGHHHQVTTFAGTNWSSAGTSGASTSNFVSGASNSGNQMKGGTLLTDGTNGTPRNGSETRVAALGINFIIKT